MDRADTWAQMVTLIEPHYPNAGNGTQPMPMSVPVPLERMLRIPY